jgi:uncharacterized protein YuzE
MAKIKVYFDPVGNTLTVWFENPADECIVEETADEVLLMKNRAGKVIGFEKLNYLTGKSQPMQVAFETLVA